MTPNKINNNRRSRRKNTNISSVIISKGKTTTAGIGSSRLVTSSSADFQTALSRKFLSAKPLRLRKKTETNSISKQAITIRNEGSIEDWSRIEKVALKRSQSQSCAICHEFYRCGNKQFILSCSHVFHTNCITSFERFVGFSKRFCPLCRVQNYSKNITAVGSDSRKRNAATAIQQQFRGFAARRKFRVKMRSYYEHETSSEDTLFLKNRQRFYIKELKDFGNKVVQEIENEKWLSLENEIEKSLALSRNLTHMLDSKKKSSTVDWNIVMKAAFNRKNGDKEQECICPICMTYIQKEKTARKASAMLLSCSHIFCKGCIEAFEEFNAHRCDVMKVCPVCRSSYEKLQVVI